LTSTALYAYPTAPLMLVIAALQVLEPGQVRRKLGRLVDQDGEVLRADPVLLAPVLKLDQGDLVVGALAVQAGVLWGGHNINISFRVEAVLT